MLEQKPKVAIAVMTCRVHCTLRHFMVHGLMAERYEALLTLLCHTATDAFAWLFRELLVSMDPALMSSNGSI